MVAARRDEWQRLQRDPSTPLRCAQDDNGGKRSRVAALAGLEAHVDQLFIESTEIRPEHGLAAGQQQKQQPQQSYVQPAAPQVDDAFSDDDLPF